MFIDDSEINRSLFDARTNKKWVGEQLEVFKCSSCASIFLGIPDCHIAFADPINLDVTVEYNLARKMICPGCNQEVYDNRSTERTKNEISLCDFLESGWSWLKQKQY